MIVNNAVCSNVLQGEGGVSDLPYIQANAMDNMGWRNPAIAEAIHNKFLNDLTSEYGLSHWRCSEKFIANVRFSINCISWLGSAFKQFEGKVLNDEEEYLMVTKPQQLGLTNLLFGETLVSHFSFFTQRDYLDQTSILLKYKKVLETTKWIDLDILNFVEDAVRLADELGNSLNSGKKEINFQEATYPRFQNIEYPVSSCEHKPNEQDVDVNSTNLNLPYIASSQAQKHVTHNEAIRMLDVVVQLSVDTRTETTPPATPVEGARYIIADQATNQWEGKDNQIAAWQDGEWAFLSPQSGWLAWLQDEQLFCTWTGTDWATLPATQAGGLQNQPFIGVNASASISERFSVASNNSLFTHEGTDHRVKINRSQNTDTASALFQTNYLGNAEIGLTGDNDFQIKVSETGTDWNTALRVNRQNGECVFPVGIASGGWVSGHQINAYGPAGSFRGHSMMTDGVFRFDLGVNNVAETGANQGSNFYINRFADDGSYLGTSIEINRASGDVFLNGGLAQSSANLSAPSFDTANLPSASSKGVGALIVVTDDVSGMVLAFSDGSNWRRSTDQSIIT